MMNQKQYISRKKIFGIPFPLLKTTSLSKNEVIIPKNFSSHTTVLYLAGPNSNQTDLDSWSASIRKRFENEQVKHLEVLFISDQSKKDQIIDQLKKDIANEFHDMIAIADQPFEELKKTLLLVDPKDIFVFVLDEFGKVIFSAQGPADEFRLYRINKAIFNSLVTDQEKLKVIGAKSKLKKKVAFVGSINNISTHLVSELVERNSIQEIQLLLSKPSQFHHVKIFEQIVNQDDFKLINTINNYEEVILFDLDYKTLEAYIEKINTCNIENIKVISCDLEKISENQKKSIESKFEPLNLQWINHYVFLGQKSEHFLDYLKKLFLFAISPFLFGKFKHFKPITPKKFADKII